VPRVNSEELGRWRTIDASVTLAKFADHAKRDHTFEPIKDQTTVRWHATVNGREFELLLTGHKFFDTRAKKGGGGAVDLAMHLLQVDFKAATGMLRVKNL